MTNRALVDHGTLCGAHAILYAGSSPFHAPVPDVSISCLSTLIESIVLFDELVLPGVPHVFSHSLSQSFGGAVTLKPLDGAHWLEVESEAGRWVCDNVDLESALDFSQVELKGTRLATSADKTIRAALAVLSADSFADIWGVKTISETWNRAEPEGRAGDIARPWQPDAQMLERLRQLHGAEYRQLSKNSRARPDFVVADFENIYWSVFRSRCYDMIAAAFDLAYIPHPIRCRASLAVRGLDMKSVASVNPFLKALKDAHADGRRYVHDKTGDWVEPFVFSPLLPYVLSKSKGKEDILEVTYAIRDMKIVKDLRACLATLSESHTLKSRVSLAHELDELRRMLDAELGIAESKQTVAFSIAGMISTTLPMPPALSRIFNSYGNRSLNPRLLFLRDIYREMALSASLGSSYEFLTRTRHKAEPLVTSEQTIKARAQYLYALLQQNGLNEKDAYGSTYQILRKQTGVRAERVRALMEEALWP